MNPRTVGSLWNDNADAWTRLVRAGFDTYRDGLNTPSFFAMLPDVTGLSGLDIGCGEGQSTRLLAKRNARMTGIDISQKLIHHANSFESREPIGINFQVANAAQLPFSNGSFDFATAMMSLMDMPDVELVVAEVHRVLSAGGFFQFSISHPCFDTPRRRNLRDEKGRTYAFEVGDYFLNLDGKIDEWIFKTPPEDVRKSLRPFRIPRFTRTLSQWLNMLLRCEFHLEHAAEPRPDESTIQRDPELQDAQVVAYFLQVRVRKAVRITN